MASKEQWENEGTSSSDEDENSRNEPETTVADPEQDQAALTAKSQGSSIPGELESSQQRPQYTEGGRLVQQCTEPAGRHSPVCGMACHFPDTGGCRAEVGAKFLAS